MTTDFLSQYIYGMSESHDNDDDDKEVIACQAGLIGKSEQWSKISK